MVIHKNMQGLSAFIALLLIFSCGKREGHHEHQPDEKLNHVLNNISLGLTSNPIKNYIPVHDRADTSEDKYSVMCNQGESITGLEYRDNDDDHLVGMYCSPTGLTGAIRYEQLNNLSGSKYFKSCNSDEVIIGVYYDSTGDRQTLGFYCQKIVTSSDSEPEYFQVSGLSGDLYDVHCPASTAVSGFKYFDSGDDHIGGLFCKVSSQTNHPSFRIYPLPLTRGHWQITQGNDSQTGSTHHGSNKFSWDFELVDDQKHFHPETGRNHKEDPNGNYSMGQTVYAVASGKLILGFRDPADSDSSNIIVILHRESPDKPYDGTRSIYDHFDDHGFLVGVGENYEQLATEYAGEYYLPGIDVVKGQPIGLIGYTGTSYPHLHFSVRDKNQDDATVPVRFDSYWSINYDGSNPTLQIEGVPKEWEVIAPTESEAFNPSLP